MKQCEESHLFHKAKLNMIYTNKTYTHTRDAQIQIYIYNEHILQIYHQYTHDTCNKTRAERGYVAMLCLCLLLITCIIYVADVQ